MGFVGGHNWEINIASEVCIRTLIEILLNVAVLKHIFLFRVSSLNNLSYVIGDFIPQDFSILLIVVFSQILKAFTLSEPSSL